jgi:hypothetical protein
MQKWEYAMLTAREDDDARKRMFGLGIFSSSGTKRERALGKPSKGAFGKPATDKQGNQLFDPPTNQEGWSWFFSKIVELGDAGWEMISAPSFEILSAGSTSVWVTTTYYWFKRPLV